MTVKKYNYTGDLSVEELNAVLKANPENNKLIYEKIKKENISKKQIFLAKMIGRILTDDISRNLKSISKITPSTISSSLLSDSASTYIEERLLYINNIYAYNSSLIKSIIDNKDLKELQQLKFKVDETLPQSQVSWSITDSNNLHSNLSTKFYLDIKEMDVVNSTSISFL